MPPILPSTSSHSPVWMPARTSMPRSPTARTIEPAHRTARAGPSKVARNPSPAVSTSLPLKRSSSRRTAAWWASHEPRSVAELCRALGRADDVGEEHRRQDTVRLRPMPHAGEELLDLVEDLVGVDPGQMVVPRQLDEARTRDVLGDVAALSRSKLKLKGAPSGRSARVNEASSHASFPGTLIVNVSPQRVSSRAGGRPRGTTAPSFASLLFIVCLETPMSSRSDAWTPLRCQRSRSRKCTAFICFAPSATANPSALPSSVYQAGGNVPPDFSPRRRAGFPLAIAVSLNES